MPRSVVLEDVAIVGAGPAGSRAAYVLARGGVRVTIFDGSHPREKPCGGGVTGRALALVADAIDPAAFPQTAIRSARFTQVGLRGQTSRSDFQVRPPGQTSRSDFQVRPPGQTSGSDFEVRPPGQTSRSDLGVRVELTPGALAVTSREAFDGALLAAAQRAGATLVRSRVADVAIDGSGVTLTVTGGARHRAAYVIGADGANSLVRRRAATPFRRDQLSIATGYFAHGVTSDQIVIELTGDPPGYIWSFPRPGHLAIGICAQADAGIGAAALRERTASWMAATGIAAGAALEPYSWPIPSLSAPDFDAVELAGTRWALVGDAAGLVDPITREGIYFALASGQWIADALQADGTARRYIARVRDEVIAELARAARLKAGFFRPAFTGLMMRALQESACVRAVMADLVAGQQSYATLKWRLLKTFEVGLAWRALRSYTAAVRG